MLFLKGLFIMSSIYSQTPIINVEKTCDNCKNSFIIHNKNSQVVSVCIAIPFSDHNISNHGREGLMDLLSLMVLEGAGKLNKDQFKRFLLDKKITLNVYSNNDNVFIIFKTVKEFLHDAFHVVKSIIENPHIKENDLKIVKKRVLASLMQSMHNPSVVAKESLLKEIFETKHPYIASIDKKITQINHYTVDNLKEFWKKIINVNNMYITGVGAITKDEINHFKTQLAKIAHNKEEAISTKKIPIKNLGNNIHVKMDIPQTIIVFALPAISRQNTDIYAINLALKVFASGDFESRLINEIREKKGLAYNCSANIEFNRITDYIIGYTATKESSANEVVQIIKNEFKKLIEKGITQEEFEFQKSNIIGSYPLAFDGSMEIASMVTNIAIDGFDPTKYINERNELYDKLTLEEVNSAIQKYIDLKDLIILTVGRNKIQSPL